MGSYFVIPKRRTEFLFGVLGFNLGCDGAIFTSQSPSDAFRFLLSKGVLSGLKMVTQFFLKSAEQSEFNSCPI